MRRIAIDSSLSFALVFSIASVAFGQDAPPPLPPPQQPQPQYAPPLPPPQQPQPQYAPPPGYGQPPPNYYPQQPPPNYAPPPSYYPTRPAPPPVEYTPAEVPTHAPKFSLWLGGRLSYLGFGGSWYRNADGNKETTGNLVGNGLAPGFDIGARISYRYIPYVFLEHGFMATGHRFDALPDTSASTDFYGVGFRFLSGDVDTVAFCSDLAIGRRVVSVRSGTETYSMSGLELFRLGLGAEIRLATLFAIEPMLSVSTGALEDTSGSVTFAPDQGDGSSRPRYLNGKTIDESRYVMLSLGVGIHFDVLGK